MHVVDETVLILVEFVKHKIGDCCISAVNNSSFFLKCQIFFVLLQNGMAVKD